MKPPAETPPNNPPTAKQVSQAPYRFMSAKQSFYRRWEDRLRRKRLDRNSSSMLPVLMEVFAGFSNLDSIVVEEEIDSILGFLRYDYPEAIYSELRRIYFEALQKEHDLSARARELNKTLSNEQKILLGVQLYLLISRSENSRQQLVEYYLFMTNLGIAAQAIDIVYQLNTEERPSDDQDPRIKSAQPFENIKIASNAPCDVLLRSLSKNCSVVVFQIQNLLLVKNTGEVSILVRSRALRPGDFSRLYQNERIVLEDIALDYRDLVGYINAKKNSLSTQLYLTFTDDGTAEISQTRTRLSNLKINLGLSVRIEALRETPAKINGEKLYQGNIIEASIEDKIQCKGQVEISLQELNRRAKEFGSQFRLEGSKTTYMVSNHADRLEEGDILLANDSDKLILFRIRCFYDEKRGVLEILESDRAILVGNVPVRDHADLKDGDTITLGDDQYVRCHFSERIIEVEKNVIRQLELKEIGHYYDRPEKTALDSINLVARRGELICVMGPSGCGKSTLLRSLGGQLIPKMGELLMNGFPLYGNLDNLCPYIAYIPQEDAYDALLKVKENLDFSISVRCPHLSKEERKKRVDAKLIELGLNEMRNRLAGTPQQKFLSGGERKRLNAGLDMIGISDVYLFDEPTSGLSSKDSEHVLDLIRSLAKNKIVFASIHQPSMKLLQMFDKALLLDKGGKMAFYGTPKEMLEYFWNANLEETGNKGEPMPSNITPDFVFDVLETPLRDISGDKIHEQTPDGHLVPARRFPPHFWRDRFQTHAMMQGMIRHEADTDTKRDISRLESLGVSTPRTLPSPPNLNLREESILFWTMVKRAFLSKLRNRANLLTTVLEAPMLAFLISMVLRYSEDSDYNFAKAFHIPTYLFLTLVVAMFLGLTNSADEIIRDRPMLNRERNHNLRVRYYIAGKILALSTFAFIQCVIYLIIGNAILEIKEMFLIHLFWMFLTAVTGSCLGLFVSAMVHDIRTALNIIPLLLIPQIILGGALIKYEEMNRNLDFVYSIREWIKNDEDKDGTDASKLKVPLICQFMPLRWAYESLVISQAKLNPLTRAQENLENRIQTLINLPRGVEMSDATRNELDLCKQALAVVSGLQAPDSKGVIKRLNQIEEGLRKGRLDQERLDRKIRKGISAEEIYVNRKVLDLVTKAEMEREDYRQKKSPNIFFGTQRTYHPFGIKELSMEDEILLSDQKMKWYEEIKLNTLWLNGTVMIVTLLGILTLLGYSLRKQLSKV